MTYQAYTRRRQVRDAEALMLPGAVLCLQLRYARLVCRDFPSIRTVARKAGISPAHLRAIEAGTRRPSPPVLARLCTVLGLDGSALADPEAARPAGLQGP